VIDCRLRIADCLTVDIASGFRVPHPIRNPQSEIRNHFSLLRISPRRHILFINITLLL